MLALSSAEIKEIDAGLESKMDWARTRSAEAEQLALDVTRLLSCTEDRLDHIKKQGFFSRCWGKLSGKTGEMERANTTDLISMQKVGFRYINMLQEQQLMMAHSMLSLKNNLVALAVKEEETRNLIAMLAERTLDRFQALESRVDQLEVSTQLQGWLLTIEDRDYEELYPQPYIRMLKIVNDFYMYKNDDWNYQDVLFMRKALREVGINPKSKISIQDFIAFIVDDIEKCGYEKYEEIILANCPDNDDFHNFAIDNISSQSFTTIHGLSSQYVDKAEVINVLSEELSISKADALKRIFNKYIANLNVNIECTLSISDIAIEILGGLRLSRYLASASEEQIQEEIPAQIEMHSGPEPTTSTEWTDQEKAEAKFIHIDVHSLGDPKWEIKELDVYIKFILNHPDYSLIYPGPDYSLIYPGDERILKTYDFKNFEDVSEEYSLLGEACRSCTGYMRVEQPYVKLIKNICFFKEHGLYGDTLFIKDNKPPELLDIKRLSQFEDAENAKVFFDGEKWCIFFVTTDTYKYTVSGFFSDKKENRSYNPFGVLTSFDFEKWDIFSSKLDFKYYRIESFSVAHRTMIASVMKMDEGSDYPLLLSRDGKNWTVKNIPDVSWIRNIIPTDNGFVLLEASSNRITHIDTDGNIIGTLKDRDFRNMLHRDHIFREITSFNNDRLFVLKTTNNNKLSAPPEFFISNDCIKWKKLFVPSISDEDHSTPSRGRAALFPFNSDKSKTSLAFAHGKFVVFDGGNRVAIWDVTPR